MPDYAVGTVFTARDRVSPVYRKMGNSADRFGQRTSTAFRNATKHGFKFGTVVKGILAAQVIHGVANQITTGLQTAIVEFAKFDETMIGTAARFQEVKVGTKEFSAEVDRLAAKARQLAVGTRFTVVEVADTMNTLAKANIDSASAFGLVEKQMRLAQATQTDLNEATSISLDLLSGMFGKSRNAGTNIRNMAVLTDALTAGTLGANVSLTDLYETLKGLGPIARSYGTSAQEIITLSAVLGGAGLKGTRGETALKNIMLRLGSKDVQENLRKNGIAMRDSANNLLSPVAIITSIGKKLKGMGTGETIPILTKMFGLRGFAGADIIARNLDNIQRLLVKVQGSAGVTKGIADEIDKSLWTRFLKLGSAALEMGFRVLDAFGVKGKNGIDALTLAVAKFNVQPIIDSIRLFTGAMGAFWAITAPLRQFLPEIVGGFLALKVALAVQTLWAANKAFRAMAAAQGLASAATWAWNAALAANPIAWIPIAIAATVAGLIFLQRKFGIFTVAWKFWGDVIKSTFDAIVNSKAFKVIAALVTGVGGAAGKLFNLATAPSGPSIQDRMAKSFNDAKARREAPNRQDAEANSSSFRGTLNVIGAPAGSTLTTERRAPGFDATLLGAAP